MNVPLAYMLEAKSDVIDGARYLSYAEVDQLVPHAAASPDTSTSTCVTPHVFPLFLAQSHHPHILQRRTKQLLSATLQLILVVLPTHERDTGSLRALSQHRERDCVRCSPREFSETCLL